MVSGAWERLHGLHEARIAVHEFGQRGTAMIARHGVVELFPETLDAIDPGVIRRLEQEFGLAMGAEPAAHKSAAMDDVVIEHQDDLASAADGRQTPGFSRVTRHSVGRARRQP